MLTLKTGQKREMYDVHCLLKHSQRTVQDRFFRQINTPKNLISECHQTSISTFQ